MISPETKRIFYRILPFGLIWLFTGWVFLFVEAAVTRNFQDQPSSAIRVDLPILTLASVAVFIFGMLTGWLEIRYLGRLFRNKRFAVRVTSKLLTYSLIFLVIELASFPLAAAMEQNTTVMDPVVWEKYRLFFTSITHVSTTVQLSFSLLLSLFYKEISDYIGQRALLNFLTGRYHRAVEEERVFMFLDMRSSTTLAEQLGHTRYFSMLRRYYADLSDPIVRYSGEVHQYVGDEIVVSWPSQKGTRDHACIRCFFAMQDAMKKKEKYYLKHFGIMPGFKAGMHLGQVTTGEVGVVKKEILFTGDVLNSTARIQGLCNEYGASLLISGQLYRKLQLPPEKYKVCSLGEVNLRGRDENMEIYRVERAGG